MTISEQATNVQQQKRNLSREKIILAGLDLAEELGTPSVSIRKLAQKLEVTPMALYRHVGTKEDLQGDLLDAFISRADVIPQQELPWDQWLTEVARRMYIALRDQPGWIPVFNRIQLKPGALQVMDTCLGVLLANGFSQAQAVQAFQGMIHCMLGASAMYVHTNAKNTINANRMQIANYPHMAEALGELADISQQDQITMSMSLLVEGLRQKLPNVRL